jgi:3-carboxy-cis,cis-muconate cycloisomerase
VRAGLAEKLGLRDPGRSWHSDRSLILELAGWMARCCTALGKLGEDLVLMAQSGIGEIALSATGSSSTMPQKQNPVAPSVLVALARHAQGLNMTLQGAGVHRLQRDGAAWFTEWLTLPQLVQSCAAALTHAQTLGTSMGPNATAMRANLDATDGMLLAEALSFALAGDMPRPDAQARVKTLCAEARETGQSLRDLALASYPDLPETLFDPAHNLGSAPQEASTFAKAARAH